GNRRCPRCGRKAVTWPRWCRTVRPSASSRWRTWSRNTWALCVTAPTWYPDNRHATPEGQGANRADDDWQWRAEPSVFSYTSDKLRAESASIRSRNGRCACVRTRDDAVRKRKDIGHDGETLEA